LPNDRKIEWAPTLSEAENLVVGAQAQTVAQSNPDTSRLDRARAVFEEMKRHMRQVTTANMASFSNSSRRF
jgi:hypothetical protein